MAAALDTFYPALVVTAALIIGLAALLHRFRQPAIIAYMLTGVILGPSLLGIIPHEVLLGHFGGIGIVFLMFFLGMEVSLPSILSRWRIAVLGTAIQILVSVALIALLGSYLGWAWDRVLLIGFVISLSSTAVVVKMLDALGERETRVGQNVLGVLLVQDIAMVPMLVALTLMGGQEIVSSTFVLLGVGSALIIAFVVWLLFAKEVHFPFPKTITKDHELQVFAAIFTCLGFATLTAVFGLSTALGAFVAGMFISAAKETGWVHSKLHSFHVIFLAIFFVSVGVLIDFSFIIDNFLLLITLVLLVLLTNTFVNAVILKVLGGAWSESLRFGSILAQVGEFSLVLAAVGFSTGIIADFGYQTVIAITALSLLLSPLWIGIMHRFTALAAKA